MAEPWAKRPPGPEGGDRPPRPWRGAGPEALVSRELWKGPAEEELPESISRMAVACQSDGVCHFRSTESTFTGCAHHCTTHPSTNSKAKPHTVFSVAPQPLQTPAPLALLSSRECLSTFIPHTHTHTRKNVRHKNISIDLTLVINHVFKISASKSASGRGPRIHNSLPNQQSFTRSLHNACEFEP